MLAFLECAPHTAATLPPWYVDYLGFAIDFEHRFHAGAPLFMQVSRDVEALHAELQAKHYKYMNPGVDTTEWGTRDVCVIDPFNNRIVFSEPIA